MDDERRRAIIAAEEEWLYQISQLSDIETEICLNLEVRERLRRQVADAEAVFNRLYTEANGGTTQADTEVRGTDTGSVRPVQGLVDR